MNYWDLISLIFKRFLNCREKMDQMWLLDMGREESRMTEVFSDCIDRKETGNKSCNTGDPGSIPGSGRSPGEGNGKPLQYSSLENPMDRAAS